MSKYEYLLFDLDGTITDSFESVANCFCYALKYFGIEVKNISSVNLSYAILEILFSSNIPVIIL